MTDAPALTAQLESAIRSNRARYLLTAVVEGREYEVGETMIGPGSVLAATRADLVSSVGERLRRLSLSEAQIAGAAILLIEAPVLY